MHCKCNVAARATSRGHEAYIMRQTDERDTAVSDMSATAAVPAAAEEDEVRIRPITVAEYYRMGEVGIIGPDERVELLDGQLIAIPPIGPPHGYSVTRLDAYFRQRFVGRAWITVQNPVRLDDVSEPQPDVMLSALPSERYAVAHPTPDEALLVVEVAQSSLPYDRGRKLRAYARRKVREYWIVDLRHEQVHVYREPAGEGYAVHHVAGRGEAVAPLAFPDDAVPVDEILPPPTR
jgi:Uma2 family endonuclease